MSGKKTFAKTVQLSGALATILMLAGCGSAPSLSGFSPTNILYGGSIPPSRPPEPEEAECPDVTIINGGAVSRIGGEIPRVQLSIVNLARECRVVGDKISIDVGVEGLVLLGQGGTPGTYSAPFQITMKRGEKIVATRNVSVGGTIPANDAQASFTTVQRDILVPKAGEDLSIAVGFGSAPREAAPAKKKAK